MNTHYLLWATGEDQPGIVAAVTKILFNAGCNLEDSSMMRLGSEFAILLIVSSPKTLSAVTAEKIFRPLKSKWRLTVGFKKISDSQARFRPLKGNLHLVTVHGPDKPGLVYRVTELLARARFNITDLATHQTRRGKKTGYILFIDGELPLKKSSGVTNQLARLSRRLHTKISLKRLDTASF